MPNSYLEMKERIFLQDAWESEILHLKAADKSSCPICSSYALGTPAAWLTELDSAQATLTRQFSSSHAHSTIQLKPRSLDNSAQATLTRQFSASHAHSTIQLKPRSLDNSAQATLTQQFSSIRDGYTNRSGH
jgi:hypothetical protein